MAYAVLTSLSQTIDQFLNHDQYTIADVGKKLIASLQEQVIFLEEFLEKFPEQAISLETRITIAANQAEDLIEHFMYEEIRCRYKSNRLKALGRDKPTTNDPYDFRDLNVVMQEINKISGEATAIKTKNNPVSQTVKKLARPVSEVTVGLDEDFQKVKGLLCGDTPKIVIIPITGMGGIGKTTLARMAYRDQSICDIFPVRVWVTVSQNYKPENIFTDLLYSLQQQLVGEESVRSSDSTEDKVRKILLLKKYLVVLDDLWSEKAWDDIKRVFQEPREGQGSRIVITTRDSNVASHASSSSPHHEMRFMDPTQSWDLLKQKVFQNRQPPSDLVSIGNDIATSCGGLPLAIVLVAGILSTVTETRISWEEVAKDVKSAVDKETGGQFEKIISLSYSHLPHHLRPCFLYMGGFPEDHEIRISKLLKLWIAEGFVKPLEEGAAERYLEDLVRRSLAMVASRKSNGKIKGCIVHDMVRDLCKRRALDENYERRLSIAHPDLTSLARAYGSTLRSVLTFQPNESSLGGLRKFRLLRVLDVVDTDAYSLPAPVFELFHLRYLAFGCPMEIPTAISRLQNLRALIIRPSKRLRQYSKDELYLPLEIWMMPLLTHLVSFFDLLPNPGVAASPLKELLTLSVVKKLICTGEMMNMIPNLKKFGITYFGDKYYQEDYQLHNLNLLHQLEKLKLVMKADSVVRVKIDPVFPETLIKLTLSGWRLPWNDLQTAAGSLPNLQLLKLRDHACQGDTWVTNAKQFRSLEFLLIDESDLKDWVTKKKHFPKLKHLILYRCSSLSEIPDEIGEIATIKLIEVDKANKSLMECVKDIQVQQQANGNLFEVFEYYKGF